MADISVSLDSSLLTKLFGALNYPWRKKLDPSAALLGDDDSGNEDISVEMVGQGGDGELAGDGELFVDELIDLYTQHHGQGEARGSSEQALVDLLKPYAHGAGSGDVRSQVDIRTAMKQDPVVGDRMEAFLHQVAKGVELEWIEFELSRKPNSNLGNPIALENLKIAVRAKAKLCVRVFGRNICIKVTSPWIRFEGERAEVQMIVDNLKVKARAKVRNIDFVITIKILGIKFKFKIGVTGHVNRYLAKMSPVLADFSNVVVNVPGLDLTFIPASILVPASPSATTLELDGRFSG